MAHRFDPFLEFASELSDRRARLPENWVLLATVDSTNRFGRNLAEYLFAEEVPARETFIVAWEQTAGRGRQGRSWVSTAGRGLYCTWLRPLPLPGAGSLEEQLGALPLLVGIGVCRALNDLVDGRAGLKWPNDVLVDGRKIAGILIETVAGADGGNVAVIGFGVNYDFGADGALPAPSSTSLALETPHPPSRAAVVERLADSLAVELCHCGDLGYALEAYRRVTVHRMGDLVACRIGGEEVDGRFAGFDPAGRFQLETTTGIRAIASGDVVEAGSRP